MLKVKYNTIFLSVIPPEIFRGCSNLILALLAPISQNGQTHSKNSSIPPEIIRKPGFLMISGGMEVN